MRTVRTLLAVCAGGLLALSGPASAAADISPAPSASTSPGAGDGSSPSTGPGASATPSAPTSAASTPATTSTQNLSIEASFDPDTAYQDEKVSLNVTVRRPADQAQEAGSVEVGHIYGLLQFDGFRSEQSCQQKEPDDLVVCALPAQVTTATYQVTYRVGELEQWPVRYSQFAAVRVGEVRKVVTAYVTLTLRESSPSPSPSTSAPGSPSASAPAGSPSTSTPPGAGGSLPVTGTSLTLVAGTAAVLVGAGTGLLLLARRRRGHAAAG